MIDEINNLTLETHPYVIAASLRSLLYLVYMDYTVKTQGRIKDNLPAQISTLCRALCNDFKDNHIISSKEPWVDETLQNDNFRSLNQKNQWLVDILNCGAHSAGSIISKTDINSAAEKISQIIVYISILIYEE